MTWDGAAGTVGAFAFGNPGTGSPSYDWLDNSGTASDYEVRFTYATTLTGGGSTSGSYTNTSSNGTIPTSGTWYAAENEHRLRVTDSGTDPSSSSIVGTVDIRDQTTGTILATRGFSVSANNDP